MNGANVLADDAQCDELNGSQEEKAENQRSNAYRKAVPEHEFVGQIEDTHDKAYECRNEAAEDYQAQRDLGEVGNAEHGQVVEGIEVVFRDSALTAFLIVEDFSVGKPEFSNHAPKEWVRIAEVSADLLNHVSIVEPEASEVLQDLNIGKAGNEAIVSCAQTVHQAAFIA